MRRAPDAQEPPVLQPEHHQKIIALLDKKQPAAIVTATGRNPALMGALYPYPLFEDGDFDIPSVYCTDAIGDEIASAPAASFRLTIDARRIPSTACNVVARKNPGAKKKIVVCAHIDARPDHSRRAGQRVRRRHAAAAGGDAP